MNSDSDVEIDKEALIKTVAFSLLYLETVKTYLMQQDVYDTDNSIPMHRFTLKYSGVMSSAIAPATFDRLKAPLRSQAGCNARFQKEIVRIARGGVR
ncbi:hypothetical protein TNCV_1045961 [Trichonephila clavipes]|nr:hypothetical protein TNCV_1045961 [Trichonephila clavipes]